MTSQDHVTDYACQNQLSNICSLSNGIRSSTAQTSLLQTLLILYKRNAGPLHLFHSGMHMLILEQEINGIDNDVKAKFSQYNQIKTNLTASQRRQT